MGRSGCVALLLSIAVGCAAPVEPTDREPGVSEKFSAYLLEAFNETIPVEEHFYMFSTDEVCSLCEGDHFASFEDFQGKLVLTNLTVVSDFPCAQRLAPKLHKVCKYDSTSLFNSYSFPKSYLTIYKTSVGKVDSYVLYKEPDKFMWFLEENGLLQKEVGR